MSLKDFKKVKLDTNALTQLQNNVAGFTSQLVNNPILSGKLLTDIEVINGVTSISHGLGRAPQGYFVVRSTAQVSVWDVAANQTTPKATLELSASATATISIYIF